jgi:hypothetical protein
MNLSRMAMRTMRTTISIATSKTRTSMMKMISMRMKMILMSTKKPLMSL